MARVRVELIDPSGDQPADIARIAKGILEELLGKMDLEASVEILPQTARTEGEEAPIGFSVRGDDLGILIGRRGETLSALQMITTLIVGKRTKEWARIIVDVEGYRLRREEALRSLAQRIAERVRYSRAPFTLEAMPPNERRIVHMALQDSPYVSTESHGEGEDRRITISPRK
jgi:spoIIIJ-associated protein